MPACKNCGYTVTDRFVRVFGDNDNEVYGCPACMPFEALAGGEGASPDD